MCANEINYHQYGITKAQWDSCPDKVKNFIKNNPEQFANLQKTYTTEQIINSLCGKGTKVEQRKGTSVETLDKLEEFKPKVTPEQVATDKIAREEAVQGYKNYLKARYIENKDELINDYTRFTYRAKIMKQAQNLEILKKDNPMLLNTKYFAEGHATADEEKLLEEKTQALIDYYSQDCNKAEAEKEYNNAFTKNLNKKNRIGTGEQIDWNNKEHSSAKIRELAEYKALKEFDIGPDRMKMIARDIVDNEHYYKARGVNQKYDDKISKLKADALTPEMKQLQKEFGIEDLKRQDEIAKLMSEAETPESTNLRAAYKAAEKQYKADIYQAQKEGDDNKVAKLQEEYKKAAEQAKEDIKKALDPEKKKAADALVNERMEKLKEFNEAFEAKYPADVQKNIGDLQLKRVKELEKVAEESRTNIDKIDVDKLAEAMAEAQVDKMETEHRIKNTEVHWNNSDKKGIDKKDGKNHTFPFSGKREKEMREYIINNGDRFGTPVKDGETADYTYKGVGYKFSSDMYKDRMVQLAGEHGLDNEYKTDPYHKADLYAGIADRKALIDDIQNDNKEQIKLRERRMAKELFEGAGLDVGGDQTIAKRWGGLGLAGLTGAATGGATAAFMEFYSKTKLASGKFAKWASLTGAIPYSEVVNYSGVTHAKLTGKASGYTDAHLETDISGVATGNVEIPYKDTYTYSGGGTLTGTFTGSGTAHGTVYNTSQVWENGILTSEITTPQDVSIPYDYAHDYNLPYTYSGKGTVSGVAKGQANIPYTQHVSVDGKAYFETDVTLEGPAEYSGSTVVNGEAKGTIEGEVTGEVHDAKTDIEWGRIGTAALIGGISNMINFGVSKWGKTYDDTDNAYAALRGMVAEKNLEGRNITPLNQLQVAPIDVSDEDVELPGPIAVSQPEAADDCSASAQDLSRKDEPVETFHVGRKNLADIIRKKYGISDSKDLYAAVGVVKGWHGINGTDRKKNIYIAELGLKDKIELPGGKTYEYVQGVGRDSIADNTAPDKKGDGFGKYARVDVKAGQVTLSCDGSVYKFESYELAQKVADFFNKNHRMPDSEEMMELKK